MSETDTPASAGTESAPLIENDTPQGASDFDPFDTDTEDEEVIGGTEDEPEEAEQAEEPAEASSEEQAEDTEAKEAEATKEDDVVVALPDGSKVELAELKKGYLRQADYSRKTAELTNTRKAVSEQAERISRITETLVDSLAQRLPPKPDLALAAQDINAYTLQLAYHNEGLAEVERIIRLADEPKTVRESMTSEERATFLQEQRRMLSEALPITNDAKGWEKFQTDVRSVGRKVGLTDAEMEKIDDHRMLVLGYWAAKGMEAEQASRVAKQKVVSKPPVATQPRRQAAPPKSQDYVKHIRRASETGSVDDVLAAYMARKRG
jgi:hypothetical protein